MEMIKIPRNIIFKHSGREKSTVVKLLADAKDLSNTEVPKHKFGGERRKRYHGLHKKRTNMKRELLKNFQQKTLALKNMYTASSLKKKNECGYLPTNFQGTYAKLIPHS